MKYIAILGIVLVTAGIAGYLLTSEDGGVDLDPSTRRLIGIEEDTFNVSFLVAGRDIAYTRAAGGVQRDSRGRIIGRRRPAESNSYGTNTDTIFYVQIVDTKVYMVAIPRDVYLPRHVAKINAMYHLTGAEGLTSAVGELLNLDHIDYHVIVNIDIFENLVDAMGGVEINVPYDMYYNDFAAQLFIDLEAGVQHLDGDDAAGFVRFRNTPTGDYSRIDNIKTLAHAMLERLRELNVRAIGTVPELVDIFFSDIETNMPAEQALQLIPRLNKLEIYAATLPTHEETSGSRLVVNPVETEAFLAQLFGTEARIVSQVPDTTLMITNRSGVAGLGLWVEERLVSLGIPKERLYVREASLDPTPTRMLTTPEYWQDASYYTSLFHIGKQQVIAIDQLVDVDAGLELVLGEDAQTYLRPSLLRRYGAPPSGMSEGNIPTNQLQTAVLDTP
jgi:LCP family protein required for cell wall assembly